jgi:multisubunit Na+/H+ antiporter MnhE subunit
MKSVILMILWLIFFWVCITRPDLVDEPATLGHLVIVGFWIVWTMYGFVSDNERW